MKTFVRASEVSVGVLFSGAVVRSRRHSPHEKEDYGHIEGFSRNATGELILRVRFSRSNSELDLMHPANVDVWVD